MLRAHYTRVAVVQLAFHPAALVERASPREDPLYDASAPRSSLLPGDGQFPRALAEDLKDLKARIRELHDAQLMAKLAAILTACRAWGAQLVVLPEYSLACEQLPALARHAGAMTVVAGTHAVDRRARQRGVYQALGWPKDQLPPVGAAACPVLADGRLIALQLKLHAAQPERDLTLGASWRPVTFGALSSIPGPMGVMPCLDFLRRDAAFGEQLDACRFLALPSYSPDYTLGTRAARVWDEARRYGRPVLYADHAGSGGTSVYVDEARVYELRDYPRRADHLEPGDEGVIVADVDLGFHRGAPAKSLFTSPPVVPFAAASLVYRNHPVEAAYARWQAQLDAALADAGADGLAGALDFVEAHKELLLQVAGLPGAQARARRLRRLLDELDRVTSLDDLRRFTREVVLEPGVLPLAPLRHAMARGAADQCFEWMRAHPGAHLEEVEARLRRASAALDKRASGMWTDEAWAQLMAVRRRLHGQRDAVTARSAAPAIARELRPPAREAVALGDRRCGPYRVQLRREPAELLRGSDRASKKTSPGAQLTWSKEQIDRAERRWLWAIARGAEHVTALAVIDDAGQPGGAILVLGVQRGRRTLWWPEDELVLRDGPYALARALAEDGLGPIDVEVVSDASLRALEDELLARFRGVEARLDAARAAKLRGVDGHYEPPLAVADGDPGPRRADELLDAWLASDDRVGLVLGQYGAGKTTLTLDWALRRWQQDARPLPLVVNLGAAPRARDVEALLLEAAGLEDTPRARAGLRLLVRRGALVPSLDGLDELATRSQRDEVNAALRSIIELIDHGGHLLLASSEQLYARSTELTEVVKETLAAAGLPQVGARGIHVQPFTPAQVESVVRRVHGERPDTDQLLRKLSDTYDLQDLVSRPLLLGMVLETVDELDPEARVASADVYEAYLERWLDETHADEPGALTDVHKTTLAEALADQLWRTGAPACELAALKASVMSLLATEQLAAVPEEDAARSLQGAAFFVREDGDRYRFTHESFLEFFLARGLLRGLVERPAEVLDTRPLSPEVLTFVHELLRRAGGDPRRSQALRSLHRWLVDERGALPDDDPQLAATAPAAANALRLLISLAERAGDRAGFVPPRADLRRVSLPGVTLRDASLVGVRLDHAQLDGSRLEGVDLSGASLAGASLRASRWERSSLAGARAHAADFTIASVDACDLTGADFTGARFVQSTWTSCDWTNVNTSGARTTAWAVLPIREEYATLPSTSPAPEPRPRAVELAASQLPAARGPWRAYEEVDEEGIEEAIEEEREAERGDDERPAPAAPDPPVLRSPPRKRVIAKAAAPLVRNPFLPGAPLTGVAELPGRRDIINELQTLIDIGNPALLKGARRSGKSSILSFVAAAHRDRRLVYPRSLERHEPRSADDLARILDGDLARADDPAEALRAAWARIEGEPPLVLLDEIGKLHAADDSLFTWLRSVGQEGLVRVIVAGSHADWAAVIRQANRTPGSSFGNDYRVVELGPLPDDDALRFLVETAPPDVPLDRERAARWILEICGGWPLYLQIMGYALVQAARRGDHGPLVDRRALHNLYERELLQNGRGIFEPRWGEITGAAQRVLIDELEAAAREHRRELSAYRDLPRSARRALSGAGLLDAVDGWLFARDRPFFDWLRRYHGELEVRDGDV